MRLTTPLLLELSKLFDNCARGIRVEDSSCGIGRWDMDNLPPTILQGVLPWMSCIGYAEEIQVDFHDDKVEVALQETDDAAFYRYRCPETFRYKPVAAERVAINTVTPPKYLHALADLLFIPVAQRKGIDASAIENILWHLGKASLGVAHVDIWLARNLPWQVDEVFEYLNSPTLPDQGLVLSTSRPLAQSLRPPRQYRIVQLADVLVQTVEEPAIDKAILYQCLLHTPGNSLQKTMPVQWNPHNKTLVINTRDEKPWVLKGDKQAAAVNYLYQQALHDRWWVPAQEILRAVYPNKMLGRSARMQNLFRGNLLWEVYLASNGSGHYGFRMT
jgi:hypothetical protein